MKGRVIWITGYSGAGKTTVARVVEAGLRAEGVPAVYVDGDELRSIFANRWGFDRSERIDLARVYFRLCSYLSSQGLTVVIAAVAMYEEVRAWLRQNVPGAVEVYLKVPEDELLRRDERTKRVYSAIGSLKAMYDEPSAPDLVVENHGAVTPEDAGAEIVRHLRIGNGRAGTVDYGRSGHWADFYRKGVAPSAPSPFAVAVAEQFPSRARVVEVGSGNGRDSIYFAGRGHPTLGIDLSETAVQACRDHYPGGNPRFVAGDLAGAGLPAGSAEVLYSRFCLHAMTEPEEDSFLAAGRDLLVPGGRLFVEARTINDPLAREGEVISRTERIHGHYRRFLVVDDIVAKLARLGFGIDSLVEGRGFATFGSEDPVVARLVAIRR